MSTDPVTYKEKTDERNIREDEEGHPEDFIARTEVEGLQEFSLLELLSRDFDTYLESSPDELFGAEIDVPSIQQPSGRQDVLSNLGITEIISQLQQGDDVPLPTPSLASDEILGLLGRINQDVGEMGQTELLQNIALGNRAISMLLLQNNQSQVAQLQAMYDILTSVEPYRAITVSGVHEFDNANEVTPVVPESDDRQIPTRMLIIKASDSNNDTIAIGNDDITPSNGWVLDRGDWLSLSVDLRGDALFMVGEDANDQVELLGVV